MTIVGEAIVVWTATGLSVMVMKAAEKKGLTIPAWLPAMTMRATFAGSCIYLLQYVLNHFL
ncbi:hypothetical protein [Ectobacillus ponti]|uniref:Uncharacterized protein n=1 Tax=Ectobacillus ponti TaxID=2961894 RepID=A0AA42BRP0_9BACI|nr:hypothetical protein [Ectobacillus ponti]MCP8970586.1 hypothetical protein [Ectobacillus ponti]